MNLSRIGTHGNADPNPFSGHGNADANPFSGHGNADPNPFSGHGNAVSFPLWAVGTMQNGVPIRNKHVS